MCKKNSFPLNHNSIFPIIKICLELTSCSGVNHTGGCLGKVWPVCCVTYCRYQLQKPHHCLSVMKSVETAKCPKVNPSVPGVQKVNHGMVLDNWVCNATN